MLQFNKPLQPGPLNPNNWSGVGTYPAWKEALGAAPTVAAGDTVTIPCGGLFPAAPPARMSYAAAPPDVIATNGLPAAPFADFPLTVLP